MQPGHILRNRYKIIRQLGSGSFGTTYLAQDLDLPENAVCVVKNLRRAETQEELEDFIKFFGREGKALYHLGNHCNQIPRLFAHFEEQGEFYLVQEYIDGHDLSQEIFSGNKLSEAETIKLLKEILEVLKILHDKDIIHRDIKAQNLMRRNSDGKIVLIDFGAVKEISQSKVNPAEATSRTAMIGTHGYMPNEQFNGFPKLSSDVYAVGMLGIYALTGVRPQELPKDPNNFEVIWQDRVVVSPNFASVLDKMVRSNFRERYKNAGEALQALEIISSESTARTLKVSPKFSPVSSQPFSVTKLGFLIGFGVVFSLVVGIGALFPFFSEQHEPITDAETCLKEIDAINIQTKLLDFKKDERGNKLYKLNGQIKDNQLNGCGILIDDDGDKYQGIFTNSQLNGKGVLELKKPGYKYKGTFERHKFHGEGTYTFPNSEYRGNFEEGNPNAKGTLRFKIKDYHIKYIEGHFNNSFSDGKGKIIYKNNCIYEGDFKYQKPNGIGTCIDENGSSKTKIWNKDQLKKNSSTCCDIIFQ
jgi:serine/threonine protein kinase